MATATNRTQLSSVDEINIYTSLPICAYLFHMSYKPSSCRTTKAKHGTRRSRRTTSTNTTTLHTVVYGFAYWDPKLGQQVVQAGKSFNAASFKAIRVQGDSGACGFHEEYTVPNVMVADFRRAYRTHYKALRVPSMRIHIRSSLKSLQLGNLLDRSCMSTP